MSVKLKALLAAAGSASGAPLNVEELFSTYLYTGNNSTQTITNDIDLDGEGGAVLFKSRTTTEDWHIYDNERGANNRIALNQSTGQYSGAATYGLTSFNSDGFSVGSTGAVNGNALKLASWTFRKAPRFFDVVTYTGDGTTNKTVNHNLKVQPGLILFKRTDTTGNWTIWHRSTPLGGYTQSYLRLNGDFPITSLGDYGNSLVPTSTFIRTPVHSNSSNTADSVNVSGASYVAYLFAHNDGDGEFGIDEDQDIIKCGSYTGDGQIDGPEITLGFEPQWLLIKRTDATGDWRIIDVMRGMAGVNSNYQTALKPNASEGEGGENVLIPTPTGWKINTNSGIYNAENGVYTYVAIRRGPMAIPESASEVFDIKLDKAAGLPGWVSSTGVVDMALRKYDYTLTGSKYLESRLQGSTAMSPESSAAESNSPKGWDYNTGYTYSTGTTAAADYAAWMWKRAPNFFDVVAYTGNGIAGRTVSHNLGVVPEMMWVKKRNQTSNWEVYLHSQGGTKRIYLDLSNAIETTSSAWNNTNATATEFTLGTSSQTNQNGGFFIAYLFASLDGISKVGSYAGDGTSGRVIDCGFSNGARFVLAKSYTHADNWWLFDSERGIVAGNDPRLWINDSAAEVTNADTIDSHPSGFIVNNTNGELNDTGRSYIFYAIA
jgi:hypothetical protein